MSVPSHIHDYLTEALADDHSAVPVSPFVRSHDAAFPAVVYEFAGDEYVGSTAAGPGRPLVRFHATVVSRSLIEAETIGQAIVSHAPGISTDCVTRVSSLEREYQPAYDGQRSGMYLVIVHMEQF